MAFLEGFLGLIAGYLITECHHHALTLGSCTCKTNTGIAQFGSEIVYQLIGHFLHGRIHVHLHEEMNAATQIKTELERMHAQRSHPCGGSRSQIQGGDVIVIECLIDRITPQQLLFGILEAYQQLTVFQLIFAADVLCLKSIFNFI